MMMQSRRLLRQRGASLFSMLVLAVIVAFVMLLAARAFPSINEYLTIRKVVSQIMHGNPGSPTDIRNAFEKSIEIEYSIKTIGPKDLDIRPLGDTGGFVTSYNYNVEIPIYDPTVFILVKYSGSAKSGGATGP